jgi:hypothetical protein
MPVKTIAKLILLAMGLMVPLAGCGGSGLSASSTCTDYLKADPNDQHKIVNELAGKYHKPDYTSPLGFPSVAYYCADEPKITLTQFFASAG